MLCKRCDIDYKIERYERYIGKHGNELFRKVCKTCRADERRIKRNGKFTPPMKYLNHDLEIRICTQCNKEKEKFEFHKLVYKNHYNRICKQCSNENCRFKRNGYKTEPISVHKVKYDVNNNLVKVCKICLCEQLVIKFNKNYKSDSYKSKCINCESNYRQGIDAARERRMSKAPDKKKKRRVVQSLRRNFRYHNDPQFKLRDIVSKKINKGLKETNNIKNGSILNNLNYSFSDLKQHIEDRFEIWMNWENWGNYITNEWDDSDSTTWKWQLDHIIPHSTFKYISMEDQEFKDCWSLSNLRPYSAKQNILDGSNRTRH